MSNTVTNKTEVCPTCGECYLVCLCEQTIWVSGPTDEPAPEHSPLPWRTSPAHMGRIHIHAPLNAAESGPIAAVLNPFPAGTEGNAMEANAALIVRAVNSHDTLVEALEGLLNVARHSIACQKDHCVCGVSQAYGQARAALAAAKG